MNYLPGVVFYIIDRQTPSTIPSSYLGVKRPQNDVTLKMPAFEWVYVLLHQQKGMISLSPPTLCNSAFHTFPVHPNSV